MEKIVRDWYDSNYEKVNSAGKSDSFAAKKIHKLIEYHRHSGIYAKCLEVGTNNLSHVPFVHHSWNEYTLLDLRSKSKDQSNTGIILSGVSFVQADIHLLPFQDNLFDRAIATCLFHHLEDPLKAMKELKRVVRSRGIIDIFLPCDPGFAYRLIRSLTTSLKAKKHGVLIESNYLHAIEHRNHIKSLILMTKYLYGPENLHLDWFPFKLGSWNLNLSSVIRIDNVKGMEK